MVDREPLNPKNQKKLSAKLKVAFLAVWFVAAYLLSASEIVRKGPPSISYASYVENFIAALWDARTFHIPVVILILVSIITVVQLVFVRVKQYFIKSKKP
jgi:glucan phosphoethanolaminetransferase (alkaline phosphatase superfamily)